MEEQNVTMISGLTDTGAHCSELRFVIKSLPP